MNAEVMPANQQRCPVILGPFFGFKLFLIDFISRIAEPSLVDLKLGCVIDSAMVTDVAQLLLDRLPGLRPISQRHLSLA